MTEEKKSKFSPVAIAMIVMMIVALGAGIYAVIQVLSEDAPRRRSEITTVNLMRPPPPQIKEKPPEPQPIKEMAKQEQIIDPGQVSEPQGPDNDQAPAGDQLGLDAEGQAGGDAFGLAARKGGRSLLAGSGGDLGGSGLMGRYSWYSRMVETEIRKIVMKHLDEKGGLPRGKFQALVRVSFDMNGTVTKYRIVGSSGNHKMDEAVNQSLKKIRISEPPPEGMPRTMQIRVIFQS